METCCGLVIAVVIIYVVFQIILAVATASEEKNQRINSHKNTLDAQRNNLKNQEDDIVNILKSFFAKESSDYSNYASVYERLNKAISSMESTISQMKKTNEKLVSESRKEDQNASILQLESRAITQASHIAESLKNFEQKFFTLPSSRMMDEKEYGRINKKYWDAVNKLERAIVVSYIAKCEKLLDSTQFDDIFAIDIEEVLKSVWFFATEKTFSASDFQKAESVFSRIYRYSYADVIIADLYAKKKMGGEDVLRDPVRDLLKVEHNSQNLTLIASGFMWMNAYQSENTVLQHMLTTGVEMNAKIQERLHSLTNGGGKAPSGFDVKSSNNSLYFDVSALAWKDDEYIGLFENLAFQDKVLTYSLAVRDENKDLFIAQGLNVPGRQDVLNKFKTTFAEEYGLNVTTQQASCIALSGSGEEKMDGILVSCNECQQMGILIHIARIGKKLIIKFYTLFMPIGLDLAAQKQQALSMYKKLSPSVTMWESSLKDTMLMAVEQLLNAGVATETARTENIPQSGVIDSDGPIF